MIGGPRLRIVQALWLAGSRALSVFELATELGLKRSAVDQVLQDWFDQLPPPPLIRGPAPQPASKKGGGRIPRHYAIDKTRLVTRPIAAWMILQVLDGGSCLQEALVQRALALSAVNDITKEPYEEGFLRRSLQFAIENDYLEFEAPTLHTAMRSRSEEPWLRFLVENLNLP